MVGVRWRGAGREHVSPRHLPWLSHHGAAKPRCRGEALPDDPACLKLYTRNRVEFGGMSNPLAHSVLPSPRAGPFSSSKGPGDSSGGCKATEEGETRQTGQGCSQCSEDQDEWKTSPEASGFRWP